MGIGGFLASQAERDHYRFLQKHTAARVLRSCDGEMEREVHAVLGPVGVDEQTSRMVTRNLRDVEIHSRGEGSVSSASSVEDGGLKWSESVGLTAFLLKFGEGLERNVCELDNLAPQQRGIHACMKKERPRKCIHRRSVY